MTVAKPEAHHAESLAQKLQRESGSPVLTCYQCGKCSAGCPMAAETRLRPHDVMRLAAQDRLEELLADESIWLCLSCETCVTRCPQNVDLPAMIDTLRQMARAGGRTLASTTVPVFNEEFLRAVRTMGRTYEAGLMAAYKLRTFRLLEDMDKVPAMLRKGKLALLPKFVRGGAARRRIFRKAKEAEGKGR